MRFLIDGYNLMYAGGLLGKRLGPDGLRKVRHRFLNDLAERLGPVDAHQATVVFDASNAPQGHPAETPHKGLRVVYAVGEENADARIEQLVSKHSHPKALTVVSSDRRVREAASRRKATAMTSDEFWAELDRRAARQKRLFGGAKPTELAPVRDQVEPDRSKPRVTPEESARWLEVFKDLDDHPETREALRPESSLLTDEEIARIAREVEQEFR